MGLRAILGGVGLDKFLGLDSKSDASNPLSTAEPDNLKRTAEPTTQLSEEARKNRKLRASSLTAGFAPPKLGQTGLLGVS